MKHFVLNGATFFEAELVRGHVPRKRIDEAVAGFNSSSGPRLKIVTEIREQDAALGTNLLALLDLYDSHWNRWEYDPAAEAPVFEDPAPNEAYIAILNTMVRLSEKQQEAQQRVLNLN